MDHRILYDIITFFVSLILAGIILPQILLIAYNKKLFDSTGSRKIHKGVIPRLGGIAFFPSILFSFTIVLGFILKYNPIELNELHIDNLVPYLFLCGALLLMFLTGIVDDLIGVKYRAKLFMQLIAAVLIVFSGVCIPEFFGFLWIHRIDDWIGWLLTGFMVISVVNAMNLIDGIDGLAAGLSMVAFVFYSIIFFFAGQYTFSMLGAACTGTLLSFFYFNVFGEEKKRKKIFMGDTGSLTIGIFLIFCGLKILHLGEEPITMDYNPMILGISPLIVPLFDVVRVFFSRLLNRRNPFLPDKNHIHHKLMASGISQRTTMISIVVLSMFFIVINMFLSTYLNPTFIILIDVAVWILVSICLTKTRARKEILAKN